MLSSIIWVTSLDICLTGCLIVVKLYECQFAEDISSYPITSISSGILSFVFF